MQVVNEVLIPYTTNQKYRNNVQGLYLYFLDNEFHGVYGEIENAKIPEGFPGYKIDRILITDTPEEAYLL